MLLQQTLDILHELRLQGMIIALEEQLANPTIAALSFEERLGLLVDRERTHRENKRIKRLLRDAKLRNSQACLEDLRFDASRGLDKPLMATLGSCQWIRSHQNVILTGATGCGKTWIACALGNTACRQGISVYYVRAPRLFEELNVAHGDGTYVKRLQAIAKTDLLIIDDWGLAPLTQRDRTDLLEILDDRVGSRSTIITSQLPPDHWHAWINDPTLADAILDRVLHASHRIALKGESLRRRKASTKEKGDLL